MGCCQTFRKSHQSVLATRAELNFREGQIFSGKKTVKKNFSDKYNIIKGFDEKEQNIEQKPLYLQIEEVKNNESKSTKKFKKEKIKQKYEQKSQINETKNIYSKQEIPLNPNPKEKSLKNTLQKTPSFFWIDKHLNEETNERNYIQQQIKHPLFGFQKVYQAKKQLFKHQNVVIICSLGLAVQIENQLSKNNNVTDIICYCMSIDYYERLKKQKKLGPKFKKATKNQSQVIDFIRDHVRNSLKSQYKQNGQFIMMNKKQKEPNKMVMTINTILEQDTSQKVFLNKIQSMYNMRWGKNKQFLSILLKQLSKMGEDPEKIIKSYKDGSLMNYLTNSFFDIQTLPNQFNIFQPYIRSLFIAIKQVYNKKIKQNFSKIICYNQSMIIQQGLGKILKNSSFLEAQTNFTNISEDKNILFEIQVQKKQRKNEIDYGFVQLQNQTGGQNRKILFNCLNSFMVRKIEQRVYKNKKYLAICLQYGQLAYLMSQNPKNLNDQQKKLYELGQQEIKCIKKLNILTIL